MQLIVQMAFCAFLIQRKAPFLALRGKTQSDTTPSSSYQQHWLWAKCPELTRYSFSLIFSLWCCNAADYILKVFLFCTFLGKVWKGCLSQGKNNVAVSFMNIDDTHISLIEIQPMGSQMVQAFLAWDLLLRKVLVGSSHTQTTVFKCVRTTGYVVCQRCTPWNMC